MSAVKIELKSLSQLIEEGEEREKQKHFLNTILHPKDPDHPDGFIFDDVHQTVDIWWGGYEYFIELNRIKSPRHLFEWIVHIGDKTWEGITVDRVLEFIKDVFHRKGWNLYRDGPSNRAADNDEERAKLTPTLRWKVLKRDGFRCRACGSGAEQGAVLHIDHICAIANGGATEFNNLQALCVACNYGKGAEK